MYSDDDFSDPDDFAGLSDTDEEKNYDSDKDPGWDPRMDTKVCCDDKSLTTNGGRFWILCVSRGGSILFI